MDRPQFNNDFLRSGHVSYQKTDYSLKEEILS